MSILSDNEIKELCIPPSFVVTEKVIDEKHGAYSNHYKLAETFSYLTEEEIRAVMQNRLKPTTGRRGYEQNALGVLSYRPLTESEINSFKPMISPFVGEQVRVDESGNKILSYGLSSAGYDVRVTESFKIFTNINTTLIDPLNFDPKCLHDHQGSYAIIPPNSYILATTVEWFDIPRDIMIVCVGKSTLARCGGIVNCTPIEPGFSGNIVIEIANASPSPLKIYANQGIAQFLFFRSNEACNVSYADRGGKYQNQTGVQLALP
jgi:dCTP deaminase